MKKKGVSPVVATVLLISIVVVLGLIIFIWAKSFLSERAVKSNRAVEVSCGEVEFESQIIPHDSGCLQLYEANKDSALDINNIGNVPIYGVRVFEWDENLGEIIVDEPFVSGTITVGRSAIVCLNKEVQNADAFRVVPKLLAENNGGRVIYACPEKDGVTIAYAGI